MRDIDARAHLSQSMNVSYSINRVFQRYQQEILQELRRALLSPGTTHPETVNHHILANVYGQMQYHLGWVDQQFHHLDDHAGKLLRPNLLLLSYELAWAQEHNSSTNLPALSLRPALPAAAAIELAHNFTLLHDDIEDGDVERRHRPTVWAIWGIPQAILAGDAMFALARLHIWKVLDEGVEPATALDLAKLFDMTLLKLTEGQYLDLSFEQQSQVSLSSYEAMIGRKTACLMCCATQMGARLATCNQEIISGLARFGYTLGLAFQIRDDMLGVWATETELGKQPAGDIHRRKKGLPLVHALQYAQPEDQRVLAKIYAQDEPLAQEQVQDVLAVFERTRTREYCRQLLAERCKQARSALIQLDMIPGSATARARTDLEAIIGFIEQE